MHSGGGMPPHIFEIFRGTPEKGGLWLESAIGLDRAIVSMNEFASVRPGEYFIFDTKSNKVVARTKTNDKRRKCN